MADMERLRRLLKQAAEHDDESLRALGAELLRRGHVRTPGTYIFIAAPGANHYSLSGLDIIVHAEISKQVRISISDWPDWDDPKAEPARHHVGGEGE
jgi:hypothetical protein